MNFMLLSLCGLSLIFAIIWKFWIRTRERKKTVCILVLGDIGRSPRMQYHALSFAREGYYVDLVGYSGSEPLRDLRDHDFVKIHYLPEISGFQELPKFILYIVKTLWLSSLLMVKLIRDIRSSYLLVQNPPAVPTIPICWLYCRITGACFVVDWHNYAYTIMSLTLGPAHVLVGLTKFIESFFGSRADKHFCVTNAMKLDLREKWNIEAKVLYDRPPPEFKPIELMKKHSLLTRLAKTYKVLGDADGLSRFTEYLENGVVRLKSDRPGLIVSSTSWTDDEDFSILFNALHEYEISCSTENSELPDIVCAVTGKGPLKDFWTAIIDRKKWCHVKVITPWLENEDYPKLLASADLGVCLHTSTSGLDLPMKVVDMFGCGLPVCAYNYKCLNELVKDNENSYVFSNDKELAARLKDWFVNFPTNDKQRCIEEKFKLELAKFQEIRWHGNWSSIVFPSLD